MHQNVFSGKKFQFLIVLHSAYNKVLHINNNAATDIKAMTITQIAFFEKQISEK